MSTSLFTSPGRLARPFALPLCLAAAPLVAGACSRGDSPARPAPAAPIETQGRRIDIHATAKGYEPNTVSVKAGEQVTLVFTRTVPSDCLAEVAIPSMGVKKALPMNQPVAIPIKPDKSGEVVFACGMDMIHGMITVD